MNSKCYPQTSWPANPLRQLLVMKNGMKAHMGFFLYILFDSVLVCVIDSSHEHRVTVNGSRKSLKYKSKVNWSGRNADELGGRPLFLMVCFPDELMMWSMRSVTWISGFKPNQSQPDCSLNLLTIPSSSPSWITSSTFPQTIILNQHHHHHYHYHWNLKLKPK